MEPQATPQPQTSPIPPTPSASPVKNSLVLIMSVLLIVTVAIAGLFYFQIQKLSKELSKYQTQPSPVSTATPDPTADWEKYTNTAGYSIKYPISFITEVLAAGSGNKEADAQIRNLFIYKSDALEPYMERYINLEIFQIKPTYNQRTTTQTTLASRNAEKIVISDSKFDIYLAQMDDNKFIEIYVSNDPSRKEIANQILSTFQFLGNEKPAGNGTGCQYKGKTYKDGEAIPSGDKCNSCSCDNGQVACTAMACE